jgi:hypothetical protein
VRPGYGVNSPGSIGFPAATGQAGPAWAKCGWREVGWEEGKEVDRHWDLSPRVYEKLKRLSKFQILRFK